MAAPFDDSTVATMPEAVRQARAFADLWHGTQTYDEQPFVGHLDDVVRVLTDFEAPQAMLVLGYLHDIREDTDVSLDMIVQNFGLQVAASVDAITVAKHTSNGPTKAERYAASYRRMAQLGVGVVTVKVADRLSNTMASLRLARTDMPRALGFLKRYVEDYEQFTRILGADRADSRRLSLMWDSLDLLMALAKAPQAAIDRHLQAKYLPRG